MSRLLLTLDWPPMPNGALRWTIADLERFRDEVVQAAGAGGSLRVNAFQAARICWSKNYDLFLRLDFTDLGDRLDTIAAMMAQLETFERTGERPDNGQLADAYLRLRRSTSRPTASEERRALWMLVFSGPSTEEQLASDLGRNVKLVQRLMRALSAVAVQDREHDTWRIGDELEKLAATLLILRSTMGTDPLPAMRAAAKRPDA